LKNFIFGDSPAELFGLSGFGSGRIFYGTGSDLSKVKKLTQKANSFDGFIIKSGKILRKMRKYRVPLEKDVNILLQSFSIMFYKLVCFM
jgi:hypothetical protein